MTKIDELMNVNKNLSQQLHRIQNLSSIRDAEVKKFEMIQAINSEKLDRLDLKLDHLQETIDGFEFKGVLKMNSKSYIKQLTNIRLIKYAFIILITDVSESKKIGYVCVDKKIWCKTAYCTLDNVAKNCPKTCNKC